MEGILQEGPHRIRSESPTAHLTGLPVAGADEAGLRHHAGGGEVLAHLAEGGLDLVSGIGLLGGCPAGGSSEPNSLPDE